MSKEELVSSAKNFGFDLSWIETMIAKYGTKVIALVVEGSRRGLSPIFVMEVIGTFGPDVFEFLINELNKTQSSKFNLINGDVIADSSNWAQASTDPDFIQVLIQTYLPIFINQYLPIIINQYGSQIQDIVSKNLPAILDKYGPQITQYVIQYILNNLQPTKV